MTILEFMHHFPDESSCENYIKESREKAGICCKTCNSITKHYWFSGGKFFECSFCRRRSSLKSGTVMECSKVSLHNWLLAFIFMSATKKGFSCLEFQRQIGLTRYETAFRLMHKIRVMMGKRDSLYILNDLIEFDECFIEVATKKKVKENLKRGVGSQRQASVGVAVESVPLEDLKTGKKSRACGYYKMEVMGKVDADHVNKFIKKNASGDAVLFTDKNSAYVDISDIVDTHYMVISNKENVNETLKWVHMGISNLKRKLLGIHHMITYKYLQNYLNEFVYKLNRRYFGERLFDRLVIAAVHPYVQ
jgi:hypothetical protein